MKTTILLAAISAFAASANKAIAENQVASTITDISVTPDGKLLALHTPDPERHPQQSGSLHKVIVLTGKPEKVQEKFDALVAENACIRPLGLFPLAKSSKKPDAEESASGIVLVLGHHQP